MNKELTKEEFVEVYCYERVTKKGDFFSPIPGSSLLFAKRKDGSIHYFN